MYRPEVQIKGNSYISNLHIFYSVKLGRCVSCWSDLEYYNCLLLECNPKVLTYCEQPLTIQGEYGGKLVKTRFDTWAKYIDGSEEFMEIKYSDCFKEGHKSYNNTIKQTSVQHQWCLENNKEYVIRTEKDILSSLYLINNLKKIYCFVREVRGIKRSHMIKVLDYLKTGPKSLRAIVNLFEMPIANVYTLVFTLIYTGQCTVDNLSTKIIDLSTEVHIGCLDIA